MSLERFLRIIPGADATDSDTIYNLLQRLVSRDILRLAGPQKVEDVIWEIKNIRNFLVHGNYEAIAKRTNLPGPAGVFQAILRR